MDKLESVIAEVKDAALRLGFVLKDESNWNMYWGLKFERPRLGKLACEIENYRDEANLVSFSFSPMGSKKTYDVGLLMRVLKRAPNHTPPWREQLEFMKSRLISLMEDPKSYDQAYWAAEEHRIP